MVVVDDVEVIVTWQHLSSREGIYPKEPNHRFDSRNRPISLRLRDRPSAQCPKRGAGIGCSPQRPLPAQADWDRIQAPIDLRQAIAWALHLLKLGLQSIQTCGEGLQWVVDSHGGLTRPFPVDNSRRTRLKRISCAVQNKSTSPNASHIRRLPAAEAEGGWCDSFHVRPRGGSICSSDFRSGGVSSAKSEEALLRISGIADLVFHSRHAECLVSRENRPFGNLQWRPSSSLVHTGQTIGPVHPMPCEGYHERDGLGEAIIGHAALTSTFAPAVL